MVSANIACEVMASSRTSDQRSALACCNLCLWAPTNTLLLKRHDIDELFCAQTFRSIENLTDRKTVLTSRALFAFKLSHDCHDDAFAIIHGAQKPCRLYPLNPQLEKHRASSFCLFGVWTLLELNSPQPALLAALNWRLQQPASDRDRLWFAGLHYLPLSDTEIVSLALG